MRLPKQSSFVARGSSGAVARRGHIHPALLAGAAFTAAQGLLPLAAQGNVGLDAMVYNAAIGAGDVGAADRALQDVTAGVAGTPAAAAAFAPLIAAETAIVAGMRAAVLAQVNAAAVLPPVLNNIVAGY